MRQRVHLITLGVADAVRAAAFYEALGWTRVPGTPAEIAVFDLWGASLALYARADFARDLGREPARGSGSATLASNVEDRAGVAPAIAAARAAGAEVIREPHDTAWGGHVGYFADPDGHVWEVAWNPFSPLGPDGEFRWSGHAAA